ncbi:MAG: tRNA uridine-5-carboxymethylaminomethyl(34) synthesis GTPase MnmE [Blastochloris sp.]|nr:tRNA uridine-5-carboxymethylaminomethyl(34) synthesis GTPase MnmE [Blastochloris sp.]
MENDTIIALATPSGSSALALLRISGSLSHSIVATLSSKPPQIGQTVYTILRSGTHTIDDVILNTWSLPKSYTGEDLVEISCHGNMLIVQRLIEEICLLGARLAQPGEFTQRAFLNGKMDLTQAEAVIDLINARTDRALRAARTLQSGALGEKLESERENLLQVLAHLEAYIDFPEEAIDPEVGLSFELKINATLKTIQNLLLSSREGQLLRNGLRVALVGHPNAGKSSLMNALLEKNRSIVSPHAGTTRDTVEESIQLDGIHVHLIDTAGLRSSQDEIEQLGIARTQLAISEADLILWVIDSSIPETPLDSTPFPAHTPLLRCYNKSDLNSTQQNPNLSVSCKNGDGIPELRHAMSLALQLNSSAASLDEVIINTRHQHHLLLAQTALQQALHLKQTQQAPELISSDLRQALHAIGEIVGQVTNEDILDRLFKNFCIGK